MLQRTFLGHLYAGLSDKDGRVRLASATALAAYVRGHENDAGGHTLPNAAPDAVFNELVSERVFHRLPAPLCWALDAAMRRRSASVEQRLCRVLYRLTNDLLKLGDKAQQVGPLRLTKVR